MNHGEKTLLVGESGPTTNLLLSGLDAFNHVNHREKALLVGEFKPMTDLVLLMVGSLDHVNHGEKSVTYLHVNLN